MTINVKYMMQEGAVVNQINSVYFSVESVHWIWNAKWGGDTMVPICKRQHN